MKIVFIVTSFWMYLIITSFSFAGLVTAQSKSDKDDPDFITTCNEHSYCDKDKTTYVKKFACRIAKQYEKICSDPESKCWEAGDWCVCQFNKEPNSCGNLGGIGDSQTSIDKAIGTVDPPPFIRNLGFGETGLTNIIKKVVQLIYAVATIAFVLMFLISATQWILSGGDKEAVGKAKGRLTWALIGISMLALAFPIFRILGDILGFQFF